MHLSITGMGVVSPAGIGKEHFYQSLKNGRSGIGQYAANPITGKGGQVDEFNVRPFTNNFKQLRPLARASHFAAAASTLTAEDGEFHTRQPDRNRVGVITGCSGQSDDSNTSAIIRAYEQSSRGNSSCDSVSLTRKGLLELPTKYLLSSAANIPCFIAGYELALNGYSNTIISGGTSFFEAILEADTAMSMRMADSFFCGATDSLLNPVDIINLIPPGTTTAKECTVVPGEGAVFFLIDSALVAENKNYPNYGELVSCTGSLVRKTEDIAGNIQHSLQEAELSPADIDAVVIAEGADGSLSESLLQAIAGCFPRNGSLIPFCSPLPYTGYTRAAAGSFDLAFGLFILETGLIPPVLQPIDTSRCRPLVCDQSNCIERACTNVLMVHLGLTGCVYSTIVQKRS